MPRERTFQLVGVVFCLLGVILLFLAFVNPANGFLSLVATLCFPAALAFYIAAYRRIKGPGSN
jgi:hypothetical protein